MRVFNNTVCCKNHTNTNECMKLFNNMVGGEAFPNCRGKLQTRGLTKRKKFEVAYWLEVSIAVNFTKLIICLGLQKIQYNCYLSSIISWGNVSQI